MEGAIIHKISNISCPIEYGTVILLNIIPKCGEYSDRAKSYLDDFTTSVIRKNTNVLLLFVMAIVLQSIAEIAYRVGSVLRIEVG